MLKPNFVAITTCFAERRNCFADKFLIGKRAVDLRRIEESDATFKRRPDQRNRLLLISGGSVAESSVPCSRARSLKLLARSFLMRVCSSLSFIKQAYRLGIGLAL